jgi:hypothetical protein
MLMASSPANEPQDFKIQYNCGCILFLFKEDNTKGLHFDYERMIFCEEHQDEFNKLIALAKAEALTQSQISPYLEKIHQDQEMANRGE